MILGLMYFKGFITGLIAGIVIAIIVCLLYGVYQVGHSATYVARVNASHPTIGSYDIIVVATRCQNQNDASKRIIKHISESPKWSQYNVQIEGIRKVHREVSYSSRERIYLCNVEK